MRIDVKNLNPIDPNDPIPGAMFVGGVFVFVLTLVYLVFFQPKKTPNLVYKVRTQQRDIGYKIEKAEEEEEKLKSDLAVRKMTVPIDAINPTTIAQVSAIVKAHNLTLSGVRPDRVIESPSTLNLYGYKLATSGSYPSTLAMVRDIERKLPKVAVTSMTIGSADQDSSSVNATVGITVFHDRPKPVAASSSANRTSGTTPTSTPVGGSASGTTAK